MFGKKLKRTIEDVRNDAAHVARQIGILTYNRDFEIPRDIKNLMGRMSELDKEGQKFVEKQKMDQMASLDKAGMAPTKEEIKQKLEVVK